VSAPSFGYVSPWKTALDPVRFKSQRIPCSCAHGQIRSRPGCGLGASSPAGTDLVRVPGENEVMRTHGVALGTARQALAQLINWGLAEARKGSGIYVRDFRPIVREGIGRLGSSTWPSGASVWSTETEGRDLAVDQVEVSETDGKPVLLSRSWLPAAIASGTSIALPETGPGGIYARLADLGHAPARSVRTSARGCRCRPRRSGFRSRPVLRSSRSAGSPSTPMAPRSKSTR